MSSIIKSSGCLLASAFVLGLPPYSAAAVYTCISASGGKTYTSERTSACEAGDLPRIGSYQGYRLKAGAADGKRSPFRRKTRGRLKKAAAIPVSRQQTTERTTLMNILFKTSFAAVLALAAAQSAEAGSKIYTCEINGEIVYTSRASGNCHSADLPSIGRYSSSRYDSPMPSEIRTQPEPQYRPVQKRSAAKAGMPKPQPVQQAPVIAAPKSPGNSSRRAILEQELANERRALSDAQKSLAQYAAKFRPRPPAKHPSLAARVGQDVAQGGAVALFDGLEAV